jgi:methionine salvage enolase-phosphatase E1
VVLDIEGTVAPISYVVETLFPYARARLASHLAATFAAPDTQAAIALFRQLVPDPGSPAARHACRRWRRRSGLAWGRCCPRGGAEFRWL